MWRPSSAWPHHLAMRMYLSARFALRSSSRLLSCSNASKKYEYAVLWSIGGGRGGAAAAGDSASRVAGVEGARRWRRVDGMARWWRVDGALEEGRRTHEELGPRWPRRGGGGRGGPWVTRCATPRRVRDRNLTWGAFGGRGGRCGRCRCACPADAGAGASMRLRLCSVAPAAAATASHSHRACQSDPASPELGGAPQSGTRLVSSGCRRGFEDPVAACLLASVLQAQPCQNRVRPSLRSLRELHFGVLTAAPDALLISARQNRRVARPGSSDTERWTRALVKRGAGQTVGGNVAAATMTQAPPKSRPCSLS